MYTFNAEVISTAASPRQRNTKFKSIEHCLFNLLLNAHQLLQMHLLNSIIRWSLLHEKLERWQVCLLLQFTSPRVSDMKWQWACQHLHFLILLSQCTWSIVSKADLHHGCSMNASYIATTTNQTFACMPNKSWRFSPGSSVCSQKSNKIEAQFCCLYKCCWSNLILQRTKSYIHMSHLDSPAPIESQKVKTWTWKQISNLILPHVCRNTTKSSLQMLIPHNWKLEHSP
jgi:hypothetical protein